MTRPPRCSSEHVPRADTELRARAAAGLILAYSGQGSYEHAEQLARQALAEAREALPPDSLALARLLMEAGALAAELEHLDSAQEMLESALAVARAAPAGGDRDDCPDRALGELGTLRWMQGRYARASRSCAKRALAQEPAGRCDRDRDGHQSARDALQVLRQLRRGP